MRKLLLVVLLLAGTAWGAVVPDGSQLPPSDPDAPTATVPGPGGQPMRVPVVGPGANRTGGGSTGSGMSTTPLHSSGGGPVGKSGKSAKAAVSEPVAQPSPVAEVQQRFSLPNGQPVPWSLIALAVLLLMFSVGGGVYFYQSRDD